MSFQSLPSGRQGHVHKVFIFKKTFKCIGQGGLVVVPFQTKLVNHCDSFYIVVFSCRSESSNISL